MLFLFKIFINYPPVKCSVMQNVVLYNASTVFFTDFLVSTSTWNQYFKLSISCKFLIFYKFNFFISL